MITIHIHFLKGTVHPFFKSLVTLFSWLAFPWKTVKSSVRWGAMVYLYTIYSLPLCMWLLLVYRFHTNCKNRSNAKISDREQKLGIYFSRSKFFFFRKKSLLGGFVRNRVMIFALIISPIAEKTWLSENVYFLEVLATIIKHVDFFTKRCGFSAMHEK